MPQITRRRKETRSVPDVLVMELEGARTLPSQSQVIRLPSPPLPDYYQRAVAMNY